MNYIVTYVDIRPASVRQSMDLLRQYGEDCRADGGNSGIEVLQEIIRHNRFVLVEAWKDESSFQAHEDAGYTARFRAGLRSIHNSPYDQRVHHEFTVDPDPRPGGADALSIVTHVDVPPPRREETESLLMRLAGQSRRDEGSLRYDVFQQNAPRTNHFTVFAVWNSGEAFAAHQAAPHTQEFRERLGPMLGAPYDERLYQHPGIE